MAKTRKKKFGFTHVFALIAGIVLAAFATAGYFGLERFCEWYFLRSARQLIAQEKKGELSREYGYVWSEINLAGKMQRINREITYQNGDSLSHSAQADDNNPSPQTSRQSVRADMPSLSAIRELNKIRTVSNSIEIMDRHNFPLAEIKTTHTRLKLNEFNPVLVKAIIYSEDKDFYTRKLAYEYKAFARAALVSAGRTLKDFRFHRPRGTSTIHQQVAKFMLSKFDARGFVYTERGLGRKIKELKLAQALKMYYRQDDLLQVYLNHCVRAGYGMTGFYDISMGLFGKKPADLDICQSLYLARLVKWNKNIPQKIFGQIRLDMPRVAAAMKWDKARQDSILTALNGLQFLKPVRIVSEHDPLIDLANEYWLSICRKNGMPESEIAEMDFSQPQSMIRQKGNLKIGLTIDVRLQKRLERLVAERGFGKDTTLYTDVRVGSSGSEIARSKPPRDTLRLLKRLRKDAIFSEPGSRFTVKLRDGDTLVTNIRYTETSPGQYHRSAYFYTRDTTHVPGQYYGYAMMNSQTGELLAYCSRDGIGSRLSALLKNKTPNGSSLAKPILYALNYDLGNLAPYDMITDSIEIEKPLPWSRSFLYERGKKIGMIYHNTSAPGGYPVSNHNKVFEGYDYVFNHLTESNNILCVEMIYRLNGGVVDPLLDRIGDTTLLVNGSRPAFVTGTQVYSRIARIVGADADSVTQKGRRIPMPPDYYAVALGTLELSLYQQLHLFNVFYHNEIIADPADHPSLVIKDISISGQPVLFPDAVQKRNLFADFASIRPVQLGLHKRLISNSVDGLEKYDIPADSALLTGGRNPGPVYNFAKSGTSDDIIRPYNQDITTKEKANYGLWNAVLGLSLSGQEYSDLAQKRGSENKSPLSLDSIPDLERLDVTLACVGECNQKNTGARDGKSLHKYITAGLLNAYGIPVESGFFKAYEKQIVENTPDSVLFRNPYESPNLDPSLMSALWKKTQKAPHTDSLTIKKRFFFGFCLSDESYLQLLRFTGSFGNNAQAYYDLLEKLNGSSKPAEMLLLLDEINRLPFKNPRLKPAYDSALKSLAKSIAQWNK